MASVSSDWPCRCTITIKTETGSEFESVDAWFDHFGWDNCDLNNREITLKYRVVGDLSNRVYSQFPWNVMGFRKVPDKAPPITWNRLKSAFMVGFVVGLDRLSGGLNECCPYEITEYREMWILGVLDRRDLRDRMEKYNTIGELDRTLHYTRETNCALIQTNNLLVEKVDRLIERANRYEDGARELWKQKVDLQVKLRDLEAELEPYRNGERTLEIRRELDERHKQREIERGARYEAITTALDHAVEYAKCAKAQSTVPSWSSWAGIVGRLRVVAQAARRTVAQIGRRALP